MSFFQPDNVSGLFLWYRASSITGLTDGGFITQWPDDSGSGNNLIVGSVQKPTYRTNVLNGYPVVRFDGYDWLFCPTHSPSIEVAPSSLSIYTVYRTNNSFAQQTIIVNESGTGLKTKNRNFGIGINYNNGSYVTPSSLYYSWWNSNVIPITNYVTASNGKNLQASGEWMLRGDQFSSLLGSNLPGQSKTYYFIKDWTAIGASSVVNSVPASTTNIYVGYSLLDNSVGFDGDIAEIIAYNFDTSEGIIETPTQYYPDGNKSIHKTIISYLSRKYFIAGSYGCPLYIETTTPTNSGIPLYTSSQASFSGGFTLYEGSSANLTSSKTLYIGNASGSSRSCDMYISGIGFNQHTATLYVNTNAPTPDSGNVFPLFIGGLALPSQTGIIPLFISTSGITNTNKSTTLYINSLAPVASSDPLPLFLGNYGPWTDVSQDFPLFLNAPPTGIASGYFSLYLCNNVSGINSGSGIPLYTTSNQYIPTGSGDSNMPLYIERWPANKLPMFMHGSITQSSGIPLFTIARNFTSSSGTPLFIHGLYHSSSPMPLFVYSQDKPQSTGTISLFIEGPTTSGLNSLYDNIPLFMPVVSNQTTLPLYLQASPIPLPEGFLPLFITAPTVTGTIMSTKSLYLQNSNISIAKSSKLFTRGLGTLNGGLIDQATMPLYINMPTIDFVPMFIGGLGLANDGVNLTISGVLSKDGYIPLYIGSGPHPSSTLPMFILGSITKSSGIPMTISGIPMERNFMTLYHRGF